MWSWSRLFAILCFLTGVCGASDTLADDRWGSDADFFAGLIPGELLSEDELGQYYGRGMPASIAVSVDLGNGSVLNFEDIGVNANDNSTNFVDQTNASEILGNSGILQNTPIIGNNNNVTINVGITVNMNTVSVLDSSGSSINVNQSMSLSGSLPVFGN